jgi:hypothetical protein
MGPLEPAEQEAIVSASPLLAEYGTAVDRDSAYERLLAKVAPEPEPEPEQVREPEQAPREREPARRAEADDGGVVANVLGSSVFKSFARSAASAAGREISRSIFGTAPRRRRSSRSRR